MKDTKLQESYVTEKLSRPSVDGVEVLEKTTKLISALAKGSMIASTVFGLISFVLSFFKKEEEEKVTRKVIYEECKKAINEKTFNDICADTCTILENFQNAFGYDNKNELIERLKSANEK